MQNLENQLDPARFFRVHRSAIVQLDRVDALLKAPRYVSPSRARPTPPRRELECSPTGVSLTAIEMWTA